MESHRISLWRSTILAMLLASTAQTLLLVMGERALEPFGTGAVEWFAQGVGWVYSPFVTLMAGMTPDGDRIGMGRAVLALSIGVVAYSIICGLICLAGLHVINRWRAHREDYDGGS